MASVNQGAWRPGTNRYEYGFRSIANIPIIGAPPDTDFSRYSMLHDGSTYRMYFSQERSRDTLYQFAFDGTAYRFGYRSIPRLTLTGIPDDADTTSFAMLHSGGAYHAYMRRADHSTASTKTLYQFIWVPGTTTYARGHGAYLPSLSVTGFPVHTDWSRWQMLHDGDAYRFYAFPLGVDDHIHQGSWNAGERAYQFGHNSIAHLDLVEFPTNSLVRRPAMLHDGTNYRFYFQAP